MYNSQVSITEQREKFVEKLLNNDSATAKMLVALSFFKEKYGNMSIDKAIDTLDNEILNLFVENLLEENNE